MSNFNDVNGNPIQPGARVAVAVLEGWSSKKAAMRVGTVYRVSGVMDYQNKITRPSVGVIIELWRDDWNGSKKLDLVKRNYHKPQNMMVIG